MSSKGLKKKAFFSIIVAIFLIAGGCFGFYLGWKQVKAPVLLALTFHGVTDSPTLPWEIRYEELDRIISQLKRHDFNALSPAEFEQKVKMRSNTGRNFLITFDDGLKTSAEAIKKLFSEKSICSAFFIITDEIGKENYVDIETLKDLQNNYGCKIGLHGKRHYEVTKIMAENGDLVEELEQARAYLADALNSSINWYAFPFGEYNASAVAAIASTSLELCFTVDGFEIDPDADFKLLPRVMYLRGGIAAGAPDPLDWAPPKLARTGSLTITLACLVIFISLSWIVRARNLLRALQAQKNMEKEKAE